MALHHNEAKTTKAIKEAKAHCGAAIREAEPHHTTLVRDAEACHTTLIKMAEDNCATIAVEVEACCTADIRKAESHWVEKAHSIQQLHAENMQHLEMDTIEEEGRDCLSFLAACGVALQAYPPRDLWSPNGPPSTTQGNILLATLLDISPRYAPLGKDPLP